VVGVFSWPEVTTTFWAARMVWHCSLWLSIAALISSTQLRMLEVLPHTFAEADAMPKEEVYRVLQVVLRSHRRRGSATRAKAGGALCEYDRPQEGDAEKQPETSLIQDFWLLWTWQSPLMLMSYAWGCFIAGYVLHLLSPLLHGQPWNVECTVSTYLTLYLRKWQIAYESRLV
jgi:hypothetical protein